MSDALPRAVAELLDAADRMPSGAARLEVLDQAVRAADVHRDVPAGFVARRRLIDEAATGLRYDLYAAAFSWCLAAAGDDPARFPPAGLLGHYQHVIGKVVNFPEVTRAQYDDLFADVVRQFRAHGFSLRTAYLERRGVAIDFGDRAMAEEADRAWRLFPRDALSVSREFETLRQVLHERFLGNDEAAVEVADEHFARRDRDAWCDAQIGSYALLPLLCVRRAADAAAHYRRAARVTRSGSGYAWHLASQLEYLAVIGDVPAGLRALQAQLPVALGQPDPLSHYYFLRPAALLLDRLREAGPRAVRLSAACGIPWVTTTGDYEADVLRGWVRGTAAEIAARFDARNGNDFYSAWLRVGSQPGE